jgi:hypothetical protein
MTPLNTNDALWGTASIAVSMFEGSQKKLAPDYQATSSGKILVTMPCNR